MCSEDRLDRVAERLTRFCRVLAAILFGYVALFALIETSVFKKGEEVFEIVEYSRDSILWSVLLLAAFLLIAWLCRRLGRFWKNVPTWTAYAALALIAVAAGTYWVWLVQSIPYADSEEVFLAAKGAAVGDYTAFLRTDDYYAGMNYFSVYPFQLGYVFLTEPLFRLFPDGNAVVTELFNVATLAALYLGLQRLAHLLFGRKTLWILTALLIGCVQPVFFCGFPYGILPGFAAGVWATVFTVKMMQRDDRRRYWLLLPICVLLAYGVLAKYNTMIFVIAVSLGLAVDFIRKRQYWWLFSIVAIVALPVLSMKAIIALYAWRAGTYFGAGVGQLQYLCAGMRNSDMAPGWYNQWSKIIYCDARGDTAVANRVALDSLKNRMAEFAHDLPMARRFFQQKILSQWNEPSFESLWVTQVKFHYNGDPIGLLYSIYSGAGRKILDVWMHFYHLLTFSLFAVGMAVPMKKKSTETLVPVLVMLGGFAYHLLFEAKSQYLMTYFALMTVFAAYTLARIGDKADRIDEKRKDCTK